MSITAKPYSKKQLRQMYGISSQTFSSWLNKSGLLSTGVFKNYKTMRILTTQMVVKIFNHFGTPEQNITEL